MQLTNRVKREALEKRQEEQKRKAEQWQQETLEAWENWQKEEQKWETQAVLEAIERQYMEACDRVMARFRKMCGNTSKRES